MKYTRNERELKESTRSVQIAGLTGGIASGKTVASTALRSAGFNVIDADEIARALTARGSAYEKELIKMFPSVSCTGVLDRKALRALIASDASERKRLDSFMHPAVKGEIERILAATKPPVVISAPLLYETALSALCDATVCIVCPRRIKIARLEARDGVSRLDAERMIDMQIPDTVRATISDYCIPSDGDLTSFTEEVVELFTEIFKMQAK